MDIDWERRRSKRKRQTAPSGRMTPRARTVARTRGAFGLSDLKYWDIIREDFDIKTHTGGKWTGTNNADPTTRKCLISPTQGAGINNRIGREIQVKKLKIRGQIWALPRDIDNSLPDSPALVRIIVFVDQQTNGSQVDGEALMGDGGTGDAALAYQRLSGFGRFQVLKDYFCDLEQFPISHYRNLSGESSLYQGNRGKIFNWKFNFKKPLKIRFNSMSTGAVDDIVDNSVHIIALHSNEAMTVRMAYHSRAVFYG